MENVSWVKKREARQISRTCSEVLAGRGRSLSGSLPPGGFTCAALGVSVSLLAGDQTQPPMTRNS